MSKKFKIFTLRSQGLVTFVMSVAVSRQLHNSRIRDLVGPPAVLAPQEDRLASSPNQIAFGFILQLSPALDLCLWLLIATSAIFHSAVVTP